MDKESKRTADGVGSGMLGTQGIWGYVQLGLAFRSSKM